MKTYINEMTGLEWVEIDRGNGEFTSMLKSTYDEMIAAQGTPPVIQSLVGTLFGPILDRVVT